MWEIFEKLLEEQGLSAYKVSKMSGVTTTTSPNWKQGKYIPKQDKMQKLANCLGVSVEYLMTGKEKEFEMYSIQLYFYITTFLAQKIAYKISPVGFLLIKWVLLSFWVHNAIPISHFST